MREVPVSIDSLPSSRLWINVFFTGAHGTFTSYGDWSNITGASFLSTAGKETSVFVRFSTVAGSRGSADTARDVHGFATRFYTDEGNFGMYYPGSLSLELCYQPMRDRHMYGQFQSIIWVSIFHVGFSYQFEIHISPGLVWN